VKPLIQRRKEIAMKIPEHIKEILDRLMDAGFDAYVVGGSLRDALLGNEAHDWDVTSAATPDEVTSLFSDKHVIPTGIKHGTVTVISKGDPIEITTFRTDGEYVDCRRPENVSFAKSIEDDLSRRDFTVNAMAYNERRGLVDLFGGREDLERRIIRCVGDAEKRFSEDALRIMRAYRFSSQLDFEIDGETLRASHSMKNGLKSIAKERIGSEFLRLLSGVAPQRSLLKMGDILDIILPVSLDIQRFSKIEALSRDAILRLAFLMNGKNHDEILSASHSLRLSSKDTQKLKLLCLTPIENELKNLTESGARRLIATYGDEAENAVNISTVLYDLDTSALEILRRVIATSPAVSLSDLAVNGSDLIENQIASGKDVGAILSKLLDAVIEDQSLNKKEILLKIARKIKA
jgi:tRNA nucleotidyltransferase (CCA-adding enzyme)